MFIYISGNMTKEQLFSTLKKGRKDKLGGGDLTLSEIVTLIKGLIVYEYFMELWLSLIEYINIVDISVTMNWYLRMLKRCLELVLFLNSFEQRRYRYIFLVFFQVSHLSHKQAIFVSELKNGLS